MKALTLTQPWATLMALGEKKFETRSWKAPHGIGTFAITASKSFPEMEKMLTTTEPFRSVLAKHGLDRSKLPLACIVGVTELVDCHPTDGSRWLSGCIALMDQEHAFGNYDPGRFAFECRNTRILTKPIPVRGFQKFWNLPADIEAQVVEQLRVIDAMETGAYL